MFAFLSRLRKYLQRLSTNYLLSPDEQDFIRFFKKNQAALTDPVQKKMWIAFVEDSAYVLKFSYLKLALEKLYGRLDVKWLPLRIPFSSNIKPINRLTRIFAENYFTDLVMTKVFAATGGSMGWRIAAASPGAGDFRQARKILQTLKSKEELEALIHENILLGDLIYDTYLRFRPLATVQLHDPFLIEVLAWALSIFRKVSNELKTNRPDIIFTSYVAYIQYGILVRLALANGVEVYNLGTFNQLITRATPDFPYHRRNFQLYPKWLEQMGSNLPKALEQAKLSMQNRFSGVVDSSTYYMKESAFKGESKTPLFSEGQRILIMGHDFFDSPHIYGSMLFPDFLEWIEFLFRETRGKPYQVYYKPHPNSVDGNTEVVDYLKTKYKHVRFVDPKASNLQIIKEGVDLMVTVYGTVAHEFAYAGLSVVCCGENPHKVFDFCETVMTRERLLELIHDPNKVKASRDPDEVLRFLAVHNWRQFSQPLELFPWDLNFKLPGSLQTVELEKKHEARLELMIQSLKQTETY